MTLFDNTKTQQTPTLPTVEEGKFFEALVGEGKKFKDNEALAKGKWESDNYAARLEAELAEARSEIQTRITLEDAIREIKATGQAQAPSNSQAHQPSEPAPQANAPKQLSQDELDALLEAKLNKRQEQDLATRNLEQVRSELARVWGNSSKANLEQKVIELGVSREFLDAMAARSPKAFMKLVGIEGAASAQAPDFTPPRPSINSPLGNPSGTKNWAYFQKMLRDDPKQYHDKKTQLEIYKLAREQGEKFYS